jgi:iron complex transport system ATP-binding protein
MLNHLDLKYQHQLLQVAKDLCKQNVTVIAILHDINLALGFADRILFMKQGAIRFEIRDAITVTALIIREIFDVDANIFYPGAGQLPSVSIKRLENR